MSNTSVPVEGTGGSPNPLAANARRKSARYASYVFWVMFAINFFNYFDRNILPAAWGSWWERPS